MDATNTPTKVGAETVAGDGAPVGLAGCGELAAQAQRTLAALCRRPEVRADPRALSLLNEARFAVGDVRDRLFDLRLDEAEQGAMMDILGTVNGTLELWKKVRELHEQGKQIEAREAANDLREALQDLRDRITELRDENRRLREQAEIRAAVELRDGAYWLNEPRPAGWGAGPYCTRCLDVDGKLVTARASRGLDRRIGAFQCPQCSAIFGSPHGGGMTPPA